MKMEDMVIVSVDDHITEPGNVFDKHLSGEALATAPKLRAKSNGSNYWEYQGKKIQSVALNAVVGRPMDEYGMEPTSLEQLRKGVYDVDARVDDMNVNGIAASLNFGSAVGFDGSRFHRAADKGAATTHLRAYNDWHIDEWCGAHPGRFIPCAILPSWDMDATVAEIHRVAQKGAKAVSVNENPTILGLPWHTVSQFWFLYALLLLHLFALALMRPLGAIGLLLVGLSLKPLAAILPLPQVVELACNQAPFYALGVFLGAAGMEALVIE